jgi:hypothetical protein
VELIRRRWAERQVCGKALEAQPRARARPRSLPSSSAQQHLVKEGKVDDSKDILERILADIDPATFDEVKGPEDGWKIEGV